MEGCGPRPSNYLHLGDSSKGELAHSEYLFGGSLVASDRLLTAAKASELFGRRLAEECLGRVHRE